MTIIPIYSASKTRDTPKLNIKNGHMYWSWFMFNLVNYGISFCNPDPPPNQLTQNMNHGSFLLALHAQRGGADPSTRQGLGVRSMRGSNSRRLLSFNFPANSRMRLIRRGLPGGILHRLFGGVFSRLATAVGRAPAPYSMKPFFLQRWANNIYHQRPTLALKDSVPPRCASHCALGLSQNAHLPLGMSQFTFVTTHTN